MADHDVRMNVIRTAAVSVLLCLGACSKSPDLPAPDSNRYQEFVSAFYVGLAGLQTGEDVRAKDKLNRASQLAPGESSTWANLALLAARQQDFDTAFTDAEKARQISPSNSRIEQLLGSIEAQRGKLPEAIAHLQKSVELDGANAGALYTLAEQTEREGTPESAAETQKLYRKLLTEERGNVAVLIDFSRMAAKRGDAAGLKYGLAELTAESTGWPEEARERLSAVARAAASNPRAAAVQFAFLRNVLASVPAYRQSLNAVKTPTAFVGEPFSRFLNLPTPVSQSAVADEGISFAEKVPDGVAAGDVTWAGAMALDDSGKFYVVTADSSGVQIAGGARLAAAGSLGRNGVLGADLNYDFKTDLVIATSAGVYIYQQNDPSHFVDVMPRSKIPAEVRRGNYSGAWAFDVDLDGDLDVVLGQPGAESIVLRNNGDGTFALLRPFKGVKGLVSFAAADIDGDGDPDVAMVDGDGGLHVFRNERLGEYQPRLLPPGLRGKFLAVAAADVNGDGMPDFLALRDDGSVVRLSDKDAGRGWDLGEIVKAAGAHLVSATANLITGDFDNNGSLDMVAGDGRLFLGDARGLVEKKLPAGLTLTGAADVRGNGRLDLIGFNRKAADLSSRGTRDYKWQTVRVRAAHAHGDQRINSFGIGGEIEVRAGLLTQKQIIGSPVLHFGLGTHSQTDVARIVWPNGSVQAEFELKADQSLLAEQRLKGSCPFLFAWDGKQMRFVKDGEPWSPALGLHINAQAVAGIYQTQEWFKVPGEALVPRNGYYDLRVTAELWETYYIDHYSLLTVDHPEGSEVYTDERFAVPPPALKIYTVEKPQPFAYAKDDNGNDVTETVSAVDGRYLDTFGRGRYQGVTRDHWVELQLPETAPRTGKVYLIGSGWMHPSDGTTNVALGQSSDPSPQGLRMEVQDADGNWVVARAGLGFLAGRMKTAVLDISDVFRPAAPRKLRLRTNLEVYWDRLAWATELPAANTKVQRAPLTDADLHYRGFSVIHVANASSPEIPDYNCLEGTAQKWRDLEGFYTRFGEVRELLEKIDDRMLIMNAGDEVSLRFQALAPPPTGWKRDYVMVGDGWIKDGDYNSTFSKTVLPIPYHAMKDYVRKPSTLQEDPGYRRHPEDWINYQTRYVTPERFVKAMWN